MALITPQWPSLGKLRLVKERMERNELSQEDVWLLYAPTYLQRSGYQAGGGQRGSNNPKDPNRHRPRHIYKINEIPGENHREEPYDPNHPNHADNADNADNVNNPSFPQSNTVKAKVRFQPNEDQIDHNLNNPNKPNIPNHPNKPYHQPGSRANHATTPPPGSIVLSPVPYNVKHQLKLGSDSVQEMKGEQGAKGAHHGQGNESRMHGQLGHPDHNPLLIRVIRVVKVVRVIRVIRVVSVRAIRDIRVIRAIRVIRVYHFDLPDHGSNESRK